MPIFEFEEGDVAICPHCEKEFEINNLKDDDYNDFDVYFEHVSICS